MVLQGTLDQFRRVPQSCVHHFGFLLLYHCVCCSTKVMGPAVEADMNEMREWTKDGDSWNLLCFVLVAQPMLLVSHRKNGNQKWYLNSVGIVLFFYSGDHKMKYSCQTFWPSAVWREKSVTLFSTHTLWRRGRWVENLENWGLLLTLLSFRREVSYS